MSAIGSRRPGEIMRFAVTSAAVITAGMFATTAATAQQQPTPYSQQPNPTTAAPGPGAASAGDLAAKLGLYVYPTKGQTKDQQIVDEQACYAWAQQQTGIDPTKITVNSDSAAKAAKAKTDSAAAGAGVGGAARGAAGGAAVGAIAGDAGTGAGVGAVTGAAAGRHKKKEAEKQAEQQASTQAQAQATQMIDTFKKAMSACLEGKGYTAK
jgi:Glycine zipper